MNKPVDPHAHWIRSADGLSFRNPAPDASPPMVPSHCVTVQVGATHPQSPASPLPEAAEPVAWATCMRDLIAKLRNGDWSLRSPDELACMVADMLERAIPRIAAPSPVAQAPAQAGEVARLAEEAKEAFNRFYLDASDKGRRGMPSGASVHLAIDRLAALATPPAHPVLAPVVREPLTDAQIRAELKRRGLHGCDNENGFYAGVTFSERHFGIQATTWEQS